VLVTHDSEPHELLQEVHHVELRFARYLRALRY